MQIGRKAAFDSKLNYVFFTFVHIYNRRFSSHRWARQQIFSMYYSEELTVSIPLDSVKIRFHIFGQMCVFYKSTHGNTIDYKLIFRQFTTSFSSLNVIHIKLIQEKGKFMWVKGVYTSNVRKKIHYFHIRAFILFTKRSDASILPR